MSECVREIAERVRELRDICGFDAEEVAGRLKIPVGDYIKYEEAEVGIPISTLYEMAGIFGVEFNELLTGASPRLHSYDLVKSGEGTDIERYKGYKFQSLAFNFANKRIEPLLVSIEPEDVRNMRLVSHPGQEFNYVLEGRVRVLLGSKEIEMSPGDSLYFDPTIPHGQAAIGGPAKFLTVILHES